MCIPSVRMKWKEWNVGEDADAADRGALRLHAPIKTRWNSVFDCINRALAVEGRHHKVLRE